MRVRRSAASGWAAMIIVLAPAAGAAQTPANRIALFALRDSLATARDTVALLTLEARTLDSARTHRDDALVKLRLGFVSLRIAELTGGAGHYRDAQSEFQWTTELQPKWPVGWYALGIAELSEADAFPSTMRGIFAVLGRDLFIQPARDIARSAEVDSSFIYGLIELSDDALHRGVGSHLGSALIALRQVAPSAVARHPAVLLARGRVEREVGDIDSAINAFSSLLDRNRFNATALLELARTKLGAGRINGVDQWYLGLALADSQCLAMYRFDLSLVMSDSALRVFDAAKGQQRVTVARKFWESRDPDGMGGNAERLREHYRRIDFAHRAYPLVLPKHRYDSLRVFEATGSRFDDRGRIFVRHGEPDERTSLTMAGIPPNESWLYRRPQGDLLFNFAQPDSAQGYRMYESLLDIVGLGTAAQVSGQGDVAGRLAKGATIATFGAAWTAQAAQELLYSRQKLSPLYGKMLSGGPMAALALQKSERATGRRSIEVGLQTDSWKFGYELPLSADVDVVAVGSDAAGTQVQVAFAIPGGELYAPPSTGIVVYPIRTRVVVRDRSGVIVASLDTLRNFGAMHPISPGENLLGRVPLSVPPGSYTVRVAVETESRGLVTKPQPIRVAALGVRDIDLSDLALGARSVPLPWRTGSADTAWINPLHRFKATEPMQLFFEIAGLTPGAPYRAQLAIMRSGRKETELQVAFNGTTVGTPDLIHREIDLGRLAAGTYVLQVTVATPGGAKAVRQRSFTVTR
jgi:GWxTD domain-containing protein